MINGKKARVLFVFLLVIIDVAAISVLYVGHRQMINRHENYLSGQIVAKSLLDYHIGEIWLNYIDNSGKFSLAESLIDFSHFSLPGCKTIDGATLVSKDCLPTQEQLSNGLLELFGKRFDNYITKDYISSPETGLSETLGDVRRLPDYVVYLDSGQLIGTPEAPLVIDTSVAVKYQVWPAFSVKMPFDAVGAMEQVFTAANSIQDSCIGSPDYRQCIINGVYGQGDNWDIADSTSGDTFGRFVEQYETCLTAPDTQCYCAMDQGYLMGLHQENDKYVFSIASNDKMVFSKLEHPNGKPIEQIESPVNFAACYFPDGDPTIVSEIRIQGDDYVRLYSKENTWRQIEAYPPLTLIKFPNIEMKEYVCILTTSLEKVAASMGIPLVMPCKMPETIYVQVNTTYSPLLYNSASDSVKPVKFQINMAFRDVSP